MKFNSILSTALILTSFSLSSSAQYPPARLADPNRGVKIDRLVRMINPSINQGFVLLDEEHSLLAADVNNDGIYEKEVELLDYCMNNHVTQLSFYDLGTIFRTYNTNSGPDEPRAWDQGSMCFQSLRWHLCRFMEYAASRGITEFLATVGNVDLGDQTISSWRFSQEEKHNEAFNPDLLWLEDDFLGNSRTAINAKLVLRVLNFNGCNECSQKFTGINYEDEYWNSTDNRFQNVIAPDLITLTNIKNFRNALSPGASVILQMYLGGVRDPTPSAGFSIDQIVRFLDGSDDLTDPPSGYNGPFPRIADRILLTYYNSFVPANAYFTANLDQATSPPECGSRPEKFSYPNTFPNTRIVPLFNAESRLTSGTADFLGDWLNSAPSEDGLLTSRTLRNIFTAEWSIYRDYLYFNDPPILYCPLSTDPRTNIMYPGGVSYYAQSQLVNYHTRPRIFWINNPWTNTDIPRIYYSGPYEAFQYRITIFRSDGSIYCQTPLLQSPEVATPAIRPSDMPPYDLPIDLSPACSGFPAPAGAFDSYRIEMSCFFSNNTVYTDDRELRVVAAGTQPFVVISNDQDGSSTPDEDTRCYGDPIILQAGGDVANAYSAWIFRNRATLEESSLQFVGAGTNSNRTYHFDVPGDFDVFIRNTLPGGAITTSNILHLTINPNPLVHIFPDCDAGTGNPLDIQLTAISLAPDNGCTYRWSTGETSSSIIAHPSDYSLGGGNGARVPFYMVTVNQIETGCERTAYYFAPDPDPSCPTLLSCGEIQVPAIINPIVTDLGNGRYTIICTLTVSEGGVPVTPNREQWVGLWQPVGRTDYLDFGAPTFRLEDVPAGRYRLLVTGNYNHLKCGTTFEIHVGAAVGLPWSILGTVTNASTCSGMMPGPSGSIQLTISGTGSGYTYRWLPGEEVTQDISGLLPGLYQVFVTDATGLTQSDYYEVGFDYTTKPRIYHPVVSRISCPGATDGEVRLNPAWSSYYPAVSCTNYAFTLDGNPMSCNGTVVAAGGLAPGTYQLRMTDPATGCYDEAGVHIEEYPVIDEVHLQPSASCDQGANGLLAIEVCHGSGNYEYHIPALNITSSTSPITDLPPGTYNLEIIDLDCPSAPAYQSSFTISGLPCCTIPGSTIQIAPAGLTIIYDPAGSTQDNTVTWNGEVVEVNGDIVLQYGTTLVLNSCSLSFSENVGIYVNAGAHLSINGPSVLSACDAMWKGITTSGGTVEILSGPTIRDAVTGLLVTNEATVDINDATFNENYIGASFQSGNYSGVSIKTTRFINSSGYLARPPYAGQRTKAQLDLDRVTAFHFGGAALAVDKNYIGTADYGIRAFDSDATIVNTDFSFDQAFLGDKSTAIRSGSSKIINRNGPMQPARTYDLLVGGVGLAACSFSWWTTGISSTGIAHVEVSDNQFDHLDECGILRSGRDLVWKNNTMNRYQNGLSCYDFYPLYGAVVAPANPPQSDMRITGNMLNPALPVFQAGTEGSVGIGVYNKYAHLLPLTISDNTIRNTGTGIFLQNVEYGLVGTAGTNTAPVTYSNRIFYNVPLSLVNFVRSGIRLENCYGTAVESNEVHSFSTNGKDQLPNMKGIFLNYSKVCNIRQNRIYQMSAGMNIKENCNETAFRCNLLNHCYHGVYLDPNGVNNQLSAQGDWVASAANSTAWNNRWVSNIASNHVDGQVPLGFLIEWLYNPALGIEYQPVGPFWVAQLPCSLSLACQAPASFDEDKREEEYGEILDGQAPPDPDSLSFLYDDQEAFYKRVLLDSTILHLGGIDDGLYQQAYAALRTNDIGLFEEFRLRLLEGNVDLAAARLSLIAGLHLRDQNKKQVGAILAALYDPFLDADSDTVMILESIAYQHPFAGGEAVFLARGILMRKVDDLPLVRRAANSRSGLPALILSPNPAVKTVRITLPVGRSVTQRLVLRNAWGNILEARSLDAESLFVEWDIAALSPGFYSFELTGDGIEACNAKLIVVR